MSDSGSGADDHADGDALGDLEALDLAVGNLMREGQRETYRRLLSAPPGEWLDVACVGEVDPGHWRPIADALAARARRRPRPAGALRLWVCWVPAPESPGSAVVQFYEPWTAFWLNAVLNLDYVYGPGGRNVDPAPQGHAHPDRAVKHSSGPT